METETFEVKVFGIGKPALEEAVGKALIFFGIKELGSDVEYNAEHYGIIDGKATIKFRFTKWL